MKAMATEFIKNCCKGLLSKEKEAEPEAIKEHVAPPRSRKSLSDTESERSPVGSVYGKKRVGCTEHFLLSRPPLDGKQVPFVVPTLKPSYIQPNSQLNSSYLEGLQGSARSMFNDRKGELSGMSQLGVDPDAVFHPSYMLHHVSPGSARRPPQQVKGLNKHGSDFSDPTRLKQNPGSLRAHLVKAQVCGCAGMGLERQQVTSLPRFKQLHV